MNKDSNIVGDGTYREWAIRRIDRLYQLADAPTCPKIQSLAYLTEIKYIME